MDSSNTAMAAAFSSDPNNLRAGIGLERTGTPPCNASALLLLALLRVITDSIFALLLRATKEPPPPAESDTAIAYIYFVRLPLL